MLTELKDLPPGVVGISASGEVSREDYERVVRPLLERVRKTGHRTAFLYEFGSDFESFSAGALWEDVRMGLQHLRYLGRCAVVSDVGWIRNASRLFGALMPCPTRLFSNGERRQAVEWLASPGVESQLEHRILPERSVLVVEPRAPLRAEDFEALALTVDSWLEAGNGLRGILIRTDRLHGWEDLSGVLGHLRFVRDHHRDVERVALVAGGGWAPLLPELAELFVSAELEHFPPEDDERALDWVSEVAVRT